MMIIYILFLIFVIYPCVVFAHGVKGEYLFTNKALLIIAQYDDGEPMAYSKIEIKRTDEKHPYQIGFTDYKGRFLFLPDKKGVWLATVQDGMGHMLRLKMDINKDLTLGGSGSIQKMVKVGPMFTRIQGIFFGLSTILFIFGLAFWVIGWRLNTRP